MVHSEEQSSLYQLEVVSPGTAELNKDFITVLLPGLSWFMLNTIHKLSLLLVFFSRTIESLSDQLTGQ